MADFIRGATFVAICVVDVLAIGFGIGIYFTGA